MIPRSLQITIGLLLAAILISGIFIIRITHTEQAKTEQVDEGPMAPPITGKLEHIQILVAYDEDHALRWRDADVFMPADRALRAREAMRALLAQYVQEPSPHPLPRGADIKDVYLIGPDTLVVDTTPQFAEGHPSGILQEEMTLISLIETVTANVPGIARVKFVVDGKERETLEGHIDLMPFYQTTAIHELAQRLE